MRKNHSRTCTRRRPACSTAPEIVKKYIDWGAGPRASQNLILSAKTHAVMHGKFSPDIEDIQKVAIGILRHRLIKNYKAEAEGLSIEDIIRSLFWYVFYVIRKKTYKNHIFVIDIY